MKCYIVTFETESKDSLKKLEEFFVSYGYYCPINDSCWAIMADEPATQIRDKLMGILEKNDRIFVIKSGTEAAWINSYGEKHDKWLKDYL